MQLVVAATPVVISHINCGFVDFRKLDIRTAFMKLLDVELLFSFSASRVGLSISDYSYVRCHGFAVWLFPEQTSGQVDVTEVNWYWNATKEHVGIGVELLQHLAGCLLLLIVSPCGRCHDKRPCVDV